jgi:hypothetical protein
MSNRAKYWARLVLAWEKSGLTQAEFCRRREVKAVTFAWWKQRLTGVAAPGRGRRRGPAASSRRRSAKFAEVVLPGRLLRAGVPTAVTADRSPAGYEIVLADGLLIRLPSDFDPEKVSQLIDLVAPTC